MKTNIKNINIDKAEFVLSVILIIILPLLLLGLNFLQLLPFIIFFSYILLIFISIKKETLKKIRYIFLIGLGIIIVFLLIAINALKSPGLESIGGLAILIEVFPIFVIGLISLILSFIIDQFYNFWEKWKFKHILTTLIIVIFIILFLFTYQYALISFYFGNYDDRLCERQNEFVIEECYKSLATKSKNPTFCNYFPQDSYDYGECIEGTK